MRGVSPEDAGALRRLVARSSARSVELRFFGPLKELSEGQARRFAEVDGVDRFALVALDPGDPSEIVGVVPHRTEPVDERLAGGQFRRGGSVDGRHLGSAGEFGRKTNDRKIPCHSRG